MKKFLVILSSIFLCSIAQAMPIQFDPTGGGDDPTLMSQFQGDAEGTILTKQELGGDGILGVGDEFFEAFNLSINFLQDAGGNSVRAIDTTNDGTFVVSTLYAELRNVEGYIDQHADGGTDTTWDDINITDDEYSTKFTQGTVDFYYDDDRSDGGTAGRVKIGTFQITDGSADVYTAEGNSTPTSDIGLTMEADITDLSAGWFFLQDGVTDFTSLDAGTLVLALADNSVNLEAFTGFQGTSGDFDYINIDVTDNGTTIQVNVVPEPTTLLLLGFGLLSVAGISRNRL